MVQQIITWLVVAVAALLLLRTVWREVEGLIRPEKAGSCPGCGMCEAAERERKGVRPPPEVTMTPLVHISSRRDKED